MKNKSCQNIRMGFSFKDLVTTKLTTQIDHQRVNGLRDNFL
jgi:hypothetical protein